jgi:hypothetical protein
MVLDEGHLAALERPDEVPLDLAREVGQNSVGKSLLSILAENPVPDSRYLGNLGVGSSFGDGDKCDLVQRRIGPSGRSGHLQPNPCQSCGIHASVTCRCGVLFSLKELNRRSCIVHGEFSSILTPGS